MNRSYKNLSLVGLLVLQIIMPISGQGQLVEVIKKTDPFAWSKVYSPVIGVGIAGAGVYTILTYLIKEDFKVVAKYPHAQAWYDAMDEKYPVAKLGEKLFLQRMFYYPTMFISWSASFNQIYFPQNALIRINSLYGMLENNQTLSDEDQLFLATQEFLLLHEAGHIEHNDIPKRLIALAALFGALGLLVEDKSVSSFFNSDYKITQPVFVHSVDKNQSVNVSADIDITIKPQLLTVNYKPLITTVASTFMIQFLLSRYAERNADEFAYTHCDDKALAGGIAFFESEEIDPLLHIEKNEYSPFIATDSMVGQIAQFGASCITVPTFYVSKTIATLINSTNFTRWLYDLHGLSHPGAPTRAYALRQEQNRRSKAA